MWFSGGFDSLDNLPLNPVAICDLEEGISENHFPIKVRWREPLSLD